MFIDVIVYTWYIRRNFIAHSVACQNRSELVLKCIDLHILTESSAPVNHHYNLVSSLFNPNTKCENNNLQFYAAS